MSDLKGTHGGQAERADETFWLPKADRKAHRRKIETNLFGSIFPKQTLPISATAARDRHKLALNTNLVQVRAYIWQPLQNKIAFTAFMYALHWKRYVWENRALGLGFRLRRTHSVSWVVSSAHKSNTLKAGCYFCLRVGLALEVKSLPHLQQRKC